MNLIDYVNPLQGTDSRMEFSTGNTYPAIGAPRGLTYWTPQTSDSGFLFDRRAVRLTGFRATHAPSPWMDDYGHFDLMPLIGPVGQSPDARASSYLLDNSTFQPNLCRVHLLRYDIDVAFSASRSCAIFEITFPPEAGRNAAIVIQTGKGRDLVSGSIEIQRQASHTRILGRSMSHSGFVPENFACYFIVEIEHADVLSAETLPGGGDSISAPRAGALLRLNPRGPVTLRIATSFLGFDQARTNLHREIAGRSLADVASATARLWESWLSRIQVDGGTDTDRRTFYCCLWRAGLFPMAMHEFDHNDRPIHYSPHTGRPVSGVLYTNNGFWDTYRTVYPLLGLIDPAGYGEIVDGYLAHYREGGWLPKWCSPGYRDCMIGSHSDVVITEAILRGIRGFDYNEAYEAIRRNAFQPVHGHNRFGRRALEEYLRLGYVPIESAGDSVSWTLDNAHCDWCIGQVAQQLGRADDAKTLLARAQNYRNLWHAPSGLMRPRKADGSWHEPWREFEWGGAYVEGGPWQHSFHVPHDPAGLAQLCGGVERLLARIQQMLALPPRFEVGSYGFEIHEMTEMASARDDQGHFGQHAHSNQPVHAFLTLPAQLGRPDLSAGYITRVLRGLYSPDRFPGDEDNGEMASWYILGAIGKMPNCAGSGQLIDIPVRLFENVRLCP